MPTWLRVSGSLFCLGFAALFGWVASISWMPASMNVAYGCLAAAGVFGLLGIVCLVWPGPRPLALPELWVADAPEPTVRLFRIDLMKKGEIWQLVLGEKAFRLVRPDGSVAVEFERRWAEDAIHRPNRINNSALAIVTEEWSPPEDKGWMDAGQIIHEVRNIRRAHDYDVNYYTFAPTDELIRAIEDYQKGTALAVGSDFAASINIKARRIVRTGVLAVLAGIAALTFAVVNWDSPNRGRRGGPVNLAALGAMMLGIGGYRIQRGVGELRRANSLEGQVGPPAGA